ncbi:butyrophilin subfamily 2 member A2-like isoform X2 [Maylandia zebra]|uniref:butyrophilin subfamily 2 member A2-like isoform X2 n=1 Tax=Maylandia zebra TaxID=106582 RepID=UPI00403CD39B
MAAGTAASLYCLMFVGVFAFVSADQKNITAESGQDVTLTCRAPNSKIVAIEWSKDLWNLLYYQIGQFDPDNQNPAYKNRVDLKDRQMKDGDVSLNLKNVTINDTGTYRCYVAWGESNQEAWLNLICTINLSVVPPGQPGGHTEDGGN